MTECYIMKVFYIERITTSTERGQTGFMNLFYFFSKNKKIALLLASYFILVSFSGCHRTAQPVTYTDFYFNTVVSLTFYNERDAALAEECFALCENYEKLFSRTYEGSDVWCINHAKGTAITVSDDTYRLIEESLYYCELTEGRIDITVAPLMDLWAFTDNQSDKIPPSQEEIDRLLEHVNYTNVNLGPDNTVTLTDPQAAIDLGFIAKGYVADQLKEFLVSKGVTSALINLGGNINVIGNKPDGTAYSVGIQKPFASTGTVIDTLQITDTSVVTSGTYERYYEYDTVIYHHILDATPGYPINNHLTGVTIICPSSTRADALSTTCFVLGEEQAQAYIHTLEDTECILIDSEGNIIP